jgi:hypothetical protein
VGAALTYVKRVAERWSSTIEVWGDAATVEEVWGEAAAAIEILGDSMLMT